jgi:hypothetical protein
MPAGYSLPDVILPPPLAEMAGVSTLIGLCVQQMGMHSLLTSELESTDTFRGSMVIGYYHGTPLNSRSISLCFPTLRRARSFAKSYERPATGLGRFSLTAR